MDPCLLSEDDIPGASMGDKQAVQLTIPQLKFWLKCRGISSSKLKTKGELVNRVNEMVVNENWAIVDPTPDGQYLARKKKLLGITDMSAEGDKSDSEVDSAVDIVPADSNIGWTESLNDLPEFNDVNIKAHLSKSGKLIPKGKEVVRPDTRGYTFFKGGYITDYKINKTKSALFVKAKSFHSQAKTASEHKLWCSLSLSYPHNVVHAYCSCIAGASGYCNHVYALLYQTRDCHMRGISHVPPKHTVTECPQQRHKHRTRGIHPEPVMTVKKGKFEDNGKNVSCSLYEARAPGAIANNPELIRRTIDAMKKENPLYGFSYMVTPDDENTIYVDTKLGTKAPLGSVLSYQLALTEGNFDE